jgi:hypothetical protein
MSAVSAAAGFMPAAFTAGVSGRGGFRDRGFRSDRFRFGGFSEGFTMASMEPNTPGYYGYGSCYLTVYGTTYCY